MNAYDAAAVLADIGAEVRKVVDAPLLTAFYDITLWLEDGSAIDLRVDKPIADCSKRMRRLVRWMSARRGNKVDYIETFGMGGYAQYVVTRARRAA